MFDIREELKKLPEKPGVYLMHDGKDEIIYVGKAISLKNRVRQYFQSSRNLSPKIRQMVSHIKYFEYIITDSELEALVLECNLIKEHNPKYNTMLKDDKSYPYIKVTVQEKYPRVLFARRIKRDKNKYFGPYTSAGAVKDTIDLIQKIYKIRTCNRNLPKDIGKERPCLYYQIKQCDAPCQGYISREAYQKSIHKVMNFLNGDYKEVLSYLQEKMMNAAQEMEFEQAAQYRDLIQSVNHISNKQKINSSGMEDQDIIALAKAQEESVVALFFVRDGKLLGREHFHMQHSIETSRTEVMTEFVKQFYAGTPYLPREILLECEIEETEILEQWLSSKKGVKVKILVPKRGKKAELVDMARRNAVNILKLDSEKIRMEEKRTIGAVKEIEQLIGISGLKRMEAFDISNFNGFETVASMVVYENGKPKKRDYRKFKIQSVKGPDDYKSMEEVLTRRFLHGKKEREQLKEQQMDLQFGSFTRFPDLLLMDGGKGQVNVAERVLAQLNLTIPVCGMVKDDNHRTRGLYYQNEEIIFPPKSEAFRLITRIQDEAHRFAIEYHRELRGKASVHSILDEINGIGPKRRKALMKYFKDIAKIKDASVEELCQVEGITKNVAEEIYHFFH
ncbi:excinuclease ABC subunit C [Anaerostipes sp. 992a]|uniref:excinuclease ABC subunit UvrC n=1 Tax=Anaerostipes sp. 992a TaxID=1261637 RepID=UPI0009526A3A|nr:excinuclease ABC subunit UvrC [Anaerostipes sp. 992a]MDD5968550.1 excinuclease ABC subunit UvrC [Anaerostipes sp.]OLR62894.1 excinuclease ABC subunit C [Anaerostipes sp. 992a]